MTNGTTLNKLHGMTGKKGENKIDRFVFGQKIGLMTKIFGCWHDNISRPFVNGKTAYRSCLQCGARKQFNPNTLKTGGSFYFPPIVEGLQP